MAESRRTPASTKNDVLANEANPQGNPNVSTGPVGDEEVIIGQEHVLGDDPRRVAAQLEGGYHDSLTGRPVDEHGNFTEEAEQGQGPIPAHRIVSSTWAEDRANLNDKKDRKGNEA